MTTTPDEPTLSDESEGSAEGTDWEKVAELYRTGLYSNRALARMFNEGESSIRYRAKAGKWEKDLTAKVQQKARTDLLKPPVDTPLGKAIRAMTSERDVIELAAATLVQVIRGHRDFALRGRVLAEKMLVDLEYASENPAEIEQAIIDACTSEEMATRMSGMFKAVSLPSRVSTLKVMVEAVQKLVTIERQSFGLADNVDPTTSTTEETATPAFTVQPLDVPDFLSKRRKVEE